MPNLSKQDEDKLLQKISDLPDSEKAQVFSDLNHGMKGKFDKIASFDRFDNWSITLFAIFGSVTLLAGILWAITLSNKGNFSTIMGVTALVSLVLTIFFCAVALIIENHADRINVNTDNNDQVVDVMRKLELLDRYDAVMDGEYTKDEQNAYKNLSAYLTFAFYCGLSSHVEALIEQFNKIAVLSEGLDKMEQLDSKSSEQYKKLHSLFVKKLGELNDSLKKLITPYLNQIVMKLIKIDRVDILPESIKHNLADNFAGKLLHDARDDDSDDDSDDYDDLD